MRYVRRFRMEIDVARAHLPQPDLPDAYGWISWKTSQLDRHASVKFESFREGVDSLVFPCLGELAGCRRLMHEITRQRRFLPQSTWLVSHTPNDNQPAVDCATIQGLAQSGSLGAIQNVGVVPEHRGLGLGRAIVLKALHGFREAHLRRVYLEVTAENMPAVELYRSIGFRLVRTMYKTIEAEVVTSQ